LNKTKTRDYDLLLIDIFFFFPSSFSRLGREQRKKPFSQIPEQNKEKRGREKKRNIRIYNRRMTKHILSSIFFFLLRSFTRQNQDIYCFAITESRHFLATVI